MILLCVCISSPFKYYANFKVLQAGGGSCSKDDGSRRSPPPRGGTSFGSGRLDSGSKNEEKGRAGSKDRAGQVSLVRAATLSPAQKRAQAAQSADTSGVSLREMVSIYQQIMPMAWAVFFIFFITLALYPSLSVHIAASSDSDNVFFTKLWVPITFLNFNLFDFCGRTMAGKSTFLSTSRQLVLASAVRVAFVPLFMFCNRGPDFHPGWPVLFAHDAYPILFMALFALSNGYVSTRLMMIGPAKVPMEQQEVAGTIMVAFLVTGLALGSAASFLFGLVD